MLRVVKMTVKTSKKVPWDQYPARLVAAPVVSSPLIIILSLDLRLYLRRKSNGIWSNDWRLFLDTFQYLIISQFPRFDNTLFHRCLNLNQMYCVDMSFLHARMAKSALLVPVLCALSALTASPVIYLVTYSTATVMAHHPAHSYSMDELIRLNNRQLKLPLDVYKSIQSFNLSVVKPTRRGRRGGIKQRKQPPLSVPPVPNLSLSHNNVSHIQTKKNAKFCSLNLQSIRNKTTAFVDFVLDNGIDVVAISEMVKTIIISDITPAGFSIQHIHRPSSKRGGGGGSCPSVQVWINCSVP